jgi:hypothetical protein
MLQYQANKLIKEALETSLSAQVKVIGASTTSITVLVKENGEQRQFKITPLPM